MTLDELIEKLKQLRDTEGGDTIVVVRGYESGYDRIDDVDTLDVYDSRARGGTDATTRAPSGPTLRAPTPSTSFTW